MGPREKPLTQLGIECKLTGCPADNLLPTLIEVSILAARMCLYDQLNTTCLYDVTDWSRRAGWNLMGSLDPLMRRSRSFFPNGYSSFNTSYTFNTNYLF